MQSTLMQQGVELMLFGMGTVFVFLALLVVLTGVMSTVLQRFVKPEPVVAQRPSAQAGKQNNDQLVAVISAAIHQHRSKDNK
ncbi:OadG family protein [Oceanicoccus sp. KOV_DT_Chl]|uniref:OadG family protein n=1 Tax=Oceanicoccus sp. KOV_DT_Chl TaxID=1904639 RepID=UPI00190E63EE|nr:OadG family protein [Oceanicoccus sp. KOV_DT_Chl]